MQMTYKTGIVLMVISSFCVCIGQLFWKLSISGKAIYLCLGFLLYAIGSIAMIAAYKYGSVSTLQPVLSIGYVFSLVIAAVVLGETITICKIIGIVIIALSVVLIGSSGN
jgi:undecaprenyl phosphate-alpha-L-ara4N flippase subunit ArnE